MIENNNILISIITINFNNANGLEKTLNSVRNQTFQNYEHIIIDGGSVDKSVEVIKYFLSDSQYAKHISYWCSEKDKGIYNAMNKGIAHANGEYVQILNSGDWLIENSLEKVYPFLKSNKDNVIYGAIDCYNDINYAGTISNTSDELYKSMIPHPASFVSLNLHKKYGFYDESYKICADRAFMVHLKDNNVEFMHIPVIVSNFSFDGISSSSKYTKRKDLENLRIDNRFLSKSEIQLRKIRHFVRILFEFLLPGFISIPLIKIVRMKRNK